MGRRPGRVGPVAESRPGHGRRARRRVGARRSRSPLAVQSRARSGPAAHQEAATSLPDCTGSRGACRCRRTQRPTSSSRPRHCGLRWCELAALRLGCVDFLRRRFVIAEAMTEVNGRLVWGSPKSHEARSVPIPRLLIDDLAAQVAGKDRDDLVFTTSTGAPLRNRNARRSWFDEAAAAIGKPGLTPRELRHTAASLAVSAGANVKAVQAMLGHASAGECGGGRGVGDDRGRSGDADRVSWGYAAPLVAGLWRGTMCRRLVGDLRPGLRDWSQCRLR